MNERIHYWRPCRFVRFLGFGSSWQEFSCGPRWNDRFQKAGSCPGGTSFLVWICLAQQKNAKNSSAQSTTLPMCIKDIDNCALAHGLLEHSFTHFFMKSRGYSAFCNIFHSVFVTVQHCRSIHFVRTQRGTISKGSWQWSQASVMINTSCESFDMYWYCSISFVLFDFSSQIP